MLAIIASFSPTRKAVRPTTGGHYSPSPAGWLIATTLKAVIQLATMRRQPTAGRGGRPKSIQPVPIQKPGSPVRIAELKLSRSAEFARSLIQLSFFNSSNGIPW
jgi:hypothetical protein